MTTEGFSNLENDCIVILTFLSDNPLLWQTYRGISRDTGIPVSTLYRIVNGHAIWGPQEWALGFYGDKYGFMVEFVGYPGRLLNVYRKL
jgi:hypothetical protein